MFTFLKIITVILGSVIAIKQIFSGGRDTISLCIASLKPDTICTLMFVKQHLCLACKAIQNIVGC
jgi:hypothetical protein